MSDQNVTTPPPAPPPSPTPQQQNTGDGGMANIIYILYLVGIAVGITSIVGVVMAYMNKGDAPEWLESHYRFQIRTFWIGMLYGIIGMVLTTIIVGFLVLLFVLVWWIVRCIKGMRALGDRQPVENVESWMF